MWSSYGVPPNICKKLQLHPRHCVVGFLLLHMPSLNSEIKNRLYKSLILFKHLYKSWFVIYSTNISIFVNMVIVGWFFGFFRNYGVPLHLIRELYETFRNFKVRVADYIRYRKITSNMNDRFPDATHEELNSWVLSFEHEFCLLIFLGLPCCFRFLNYLWCLCRSDATCIICREEMTTAKKLICGHLFHVHCLRSWLERQHTCPTCRALVVPPENGTSTAGSRSDVHQQGNNIHYCLEHFWLLFNSSLPQKWIQNFGWAFDLILTLRLFVKWRIHSFCAFQFAHFTVKGKEREKI